MEELNELLEKWNQAKDDLAKAEIKCDKYRTYVEKLMDSNSTDSLRGSVFSALRYEVTRESITKKDLPPEIWSRYAKSYTYPVISLKTMVNGKLRSPKRTRKSPRRSRSRRTSET